MKTKFPRFIVVFAHDSQCPGHVAAFPNRDDMERFVDTHRALFPDPVTAPCIVYAPDCVVPYPDAAIPEPRDIV